MVNPESVTPEWLASLVIPNVQTVVVIHIDHARELTPEAIQLVKKMQALGIMVLSQTVLLKGVNADRDSLIDLFQRLVMAGVKPYYLHHLDQATGTHSYRLSIEEGKQLYRSLRGQVSGVALPQYVLDLPGGFGKVRVADLAQVGEGYTKVTPFAGRP